MNRPTLSLPNGDTELKWVVMGYLSHMCGLSKRLKGYRYLYHAIQLCHEEPSCLEQDNEKKLLEELRIRVAAEREDMKDLKIGEIRGCIKSAIDCAWKNRLGIDSGVYPPCPLTINEFLNRSLEALSMEGPYWKRGLVLWKYKSA